MSQPCISVNMINLKRLLKTVSPDSVVCIRGRHAVGKSEAVSQMAQELGLPLVMRRLSQMTEGDLLGVPSIIKTDSGKGATTFNPCEWFLEGCEKPVVLFLDERNRALDTVKQSIFEICDSRQFYGHILHPETRVVIAENVGDSYQVQACDPAEVSRTVTVELEPTVEEWIAYAQSIKVDGAVIDFIRENGQKCLEFMGANGVYEPNKKYPDRRSWVKLDKELRTGGLYEAPEDNFFFILTAGFLGAEIAGKFQSFCKNRDKQVSVKDVITSWKKAKTRLLGKNAKPGDDLSNEKYVELMDKLGEYVSGATAKDKKAPTWTDTQIQNVCEFILDCPAEISVVGYKHLTTNRATLIAVHEKIGAQMTSRFREAQTKDTAAKK